MELNNRYLFVSSMDSSCTNLRTIDNTKSVTLLTEPGTKKFVTKKHSRSKRTIPFGGNQHIRRNSEERIKQFTQTYSQSTINKNPKARDSPTQSRHKIVHVQNTQSKQKINSPLKTVTPKVSESIDRAKLRILNANQYTTIV